MASPSEWVLTVHPASESEPCESCAMLAAAEASGDVTDEVVDFMTDTLTQRVIRDRAITLCDRHAQPFTSHLLANGVSRLAD